MSLEDMTGIQVLVGKRKEGRKREGTRVLRECRQGRRCRHRIRGRKEEGKEKKREGKEDGERGL